MTIFDSFGKKLIEAGFHGENGPKWSISDDEWRTTHDEL